MKEKAATEGDLPISLTDIPSAAPSVIIQDNRNLKISVPTTPPSPSFPLRGIIAQIPYDVIAIA